MTLPVAEGASTPGTSSALPETVPVPAPSLVIDSAVQPIVEGAVRASALTPPPLPPPLPVAGPAKPQAIFTQGLTKRYGALTALDHLDLQLEAGDVFGFIGPNGAGKSTTMKILAGLLEPTHGVAKILGKDVFSNGEFVRYSVGYMPDSFGVYEDLTVTEYLEFFAAAYHIARRLRQKVVGDVLELTDLKYKKDAFVDSLSRGMQQRLGLARVSSSTIRRS